MGEWLTSYVSFTDFARKELQSGGPDHHLRELAYVARWAEDPAWLVACYAGPYNVPGGLAIYHRFPDRSRLEGLEGWLSRHWSELPVRRECRAVKSPPKMARMLTSTATWLDKLDPEADFETLWASVRSSEVWGVGRYVGCKLLEGLRRAGVTQAEQPDMRPHGAKYPRRALAYLYPEHRERLEDRTAAHDELANRAAEALHHANGFPDIYTTEVLLCDWQQAVGGRYYPGRPLDSELDQLRKAEALMPTYVAQRAYGAREALMPKEFLGELQGWPGRRKELGRTGAKYGYWWTDAEYDYLATDGDLEHPVRRSGETRVQG